MYDYVCMKFTFFIYFFFLIKDPLKKKIYYHNFLGDIVVLIQAKYRKDRMKPEGAYSIWKIGCQTDGQTDGSASEKLCWLCQ